MLCGMLCLASYGMNVTRRFRLMPIINTLFVGFSVQSQEGVFKKSHDGTVTPEYLVEDCLRGQRQLSRIL